MGLLAPELRKFLQACIVGNAKKKSTERWTLVKKEFLNNDDSTGDVVGDLRFLEQQWGKFLNVKLSVHGPHLRHLAARALTWHGVIEQRSSLSGEDSIDVFEALSDFAVLICADKSSRQKFQGVAIDASPHVPAPTPRISRGASSAHTANTNAKHQIASGSADVGNLRSSVEKQAATVEALGELCILAMRLDSALDREASSREQTSTAISQCASRYDGCFELLKCQQQQGSEALEQVTKLATSASSACSKVTDQFYDIERMVRVNHRDISTFVDAVEGDWLRNTLADTRTKVYQGAKQHVSNHAEVVRKLDALRRTLFHELKHTRKELIEQTESLGEELSDADGKLFEITQGMKSLDTVVRWTLLPVVTVDTVVGITAGVVSWFDITLEIVMNGLAEGFGYVIVAAILYFIVRVIFRVIMWFLRLVGLAEPAPAQYIFVNLGVLFLFRISVLGAFAPRLQDCRLCEIGTSEGRKDSGDLQQFGESAKCQANRFETVIAVKRRFNETVLLFTRVCHMLTSSLTLDIPPIHFTRQVHQQHCPAMAHATPNSNRCDITTTTTSTSTTATSAAIDSWAIFQQHAAAGCLLAVMSSLHPELKRFVRVCVREYILKGTRMRNALASAHDRDVDRQATALLDQKLSASADTADFAAYLHFTDQNWHKYIADLHFHSDLRAVVRESGEIRTKVV